MRRRAFLGLAAASGWTACSRQRSVRSRTPVRVAMSPYFGSSAFYLAQETGLFEAAGFQVEEAKQAAMQKYAGQYIHALLFGVHGDEQR